MVGKACYIRLRSHYMTFILKVLVEELDGSFEGTFLPYFDLRITLIENKVSGQL